MTRTVLPRITSAMASFIFSSFSGSMKAVASSSTTIGAFFKIARAREMRCRSPPESILPPSPAMVWMPFSSRARNSPHWAFSAAARTS